MSDAAAAAEATTDAASQTDAAATDIDANGATAPVHGADGGDKVDAAPATTASTAGDADSGNVIWPEKWRELMSGGDEKITEELGRYAEPGLVGPALVEAKNRIRAGLKPETLAENATDEQIVEYRKNNGVPAEPAGYFEGMPDGLVVGEEDKAGMETLAKAMHGTNAPVTATHAAMSAYYQHIETVMAERAELDTQAKRDTDDELNQLYGPEFRRNMTDLTAWLGSAGDEVRDGILAARLPDGTPLGSDPGFLKFMIGEMRDINPLVTVPGLGAGDPGASIADEIKAIEKVIATDNKTYTADKAMQDRYLELLTAQEGRK